jgi:hypothetical protein
MPEEISANHAEKFSRKAGVPKYTSQTTIYVDRKKKATYVENVPEDYSEEDKKKLETVAFHQVTSDQLPNLKDKTVYLSIDMDYFSNTGYDTYKNTEVPCQGEIGIQKLFEAFKKSDVAPEIVNLSLSPEYSYTGNNNVRAISSLLRRGPVIETAVFLKKICRQIISKATGN